MDTLANSVETNEKLHFAPFHRPFVISVNQKKKNYFSNKTYEPRHAIMCLREINNVMRYDVVKSDVIISRLKRASSKITTI